MKKNNRGFSLVEVIVAMLIMSIMASTAVISYNVVRRRNVQKAAQNLSEALEQARLSALAKNGEYETVLLVYFNGTNYIAQIADIKWVDQNKNEIVWKKIGSYKLGTSYTLGGKSLSIFYTYGDDLSTSSIKLDKNIDYYTSCVKDKLHLGNYLEKQRLMAGPIILFDAANTNPDKDKTDKIMIFEFSKHGGEKLLGPESIMITNHSKYSEEDSFTGSEVRFSQAGRSYIKEH